MRYDYDLIIVGGGPAGATMALSAARQNLRVLLVDKATFPRDKICGDAIPPRCRPILDEYNLTAAVARVSHARVTGERVFAAGESLHVGFGDEAQIICPRLHFDNVLFQAAKTQVDTREGCIVSDLLREDGRVCGIRAQMRRGAPLDITAKVVAGADGFNSIVKRRMGLYHYQRPHWAVATRAYYRDVPVSSAEFEIHYFDELWPGYLWIFPVGDGRVNVGVGLFPTDRTQARISLRDLHLTLIHHPSLNGRFARAKMEGGLRGWNLPLASIRRPLHGDGFILAGDAAGLVDPLWGHGIDNAMISGQIAGKVLAQVCRGDDFSAAALQPYADAVWQELGPYFKFARRFREQWQNPPARWQSMSRLELLNKFYFRNRGELHRR